MFFSRFQKDYEIFIWNISDAGNFFIIWLWMHSVILLLNYPLILWKNYRHFLRLVQFINDNEAKYNLEQLFQMYTSKMVDKQSIIDRLIFPLIYYSITIFGQLIFATLFLIAFDFKLFFSFALTNQTILILMESHSYYMEKGNIQFEQKTFEKLFTKEYDRKSATLKTFWLLPERPKLTSLIGYLMAPTICYQDSYPRNKNIRWKLVLNYLFQFVLSIYIMFVILCRFLVDNFSNVGLEKYHLKNGFYLFNYAFAFGLIASFLSFYGFFHLWLNIIAELSRFGDLHYYDDWWNSTSPKDFFRKWNIVVQDWIYLYVYGPISHGLNNKPLAAFIVIIISALVHEYIISMIFRCFIPIMFIFFSLGSCKFSIEFCCTQ